MTAATVLLAIPVTGLLCYATLQGLLARGQTFLVKDWIGWSVFVAAMILALVYYAVNTVVALQDQDKQPPIN